MTRVEPTSRIGVAAPGRARIAERTLRTDRWWLSPLLTVVLLTIWVLYALVRTVTQRDYFVARYHPQFGTRLNIAASRGRIVWATARLDPTQPAQPGRRALIIA